MKNLSPIPQMYEPVPEDKLLQEHLIGNHWAMLVGCILLNRTHLRQVNEVMPKLFENWPTPIQMATANVVPLTGILKPLGLYNRRANTLKSFSSDWLRWDGKNIDDLGDLYGIGKYAFDSYMIFVENEYLVEPTDKELIKYLKDK